MILRRDAPPRRIHARDPQLHPNPVEPENACVRVPSLPHLRAMPGQPLRRARRAATRDAKGEVAPPRRLRAGLSPIVWRRLSPVEKLQSLYGLSLDAALEDLSYRGDDPHRLAARTSARHDVMMICAKYAIEMSRERERERILSEMAWREFGDHA